MKMGTIGCPETPVMIFHHTLLNIPGERTLPACMFGLSLYFK